MTGGFSSPPHFTIFSAVCDYYNLNILVVEKLIKINQTVYRGIMWEIKLLKNPTYRGIKYIILIHKQ